MSKVSVANPASDATTLATPANSGVKRGFLQFRLIASVLLLSVGVYFFISHFLLMAVEIKGVSMTPTLIDGERLLLYRYPLFFREPRLGEIVVIDDPEDHGLSIKRVVGLPDETVEMRRDGLYVNSRKVLEPYLVPQYTRLPRYLPTKPLHLPKDNYFVLGDNRDKSADSRSYGPVRRDQILGLVNN